MKSKLFLLLAVSLMTAACFAAQTFGTHGTAYYRGAPVTSGHWIVAVNNTNGQQYQTGIGPGGNFRFWFPLPAGFYTFELHQQGLPPVEWPLALNVQSDGSVDQNLGDVLFR